MRYELIAIDVHIASHFPTNFSIISINKNTNTLPIYSCVFCIEYCITSIQAIWIPIILNLLTICSERKKKMNMNWMVLLNISNNKPSWIAKRRIGPVAVIVLLWRKQKHCERHSAITGFADVRWIPTVSCIKMLHFSLLESCDFIPFYISRCLVVVVVVFSNRQTILFRDVQRSTNKTTMCRRSHHLFSLSLTFCFSVWIRDSCTFISTYWYDL